MSRTDYETLWWTGVQGPAAMLGQLCQSAALGGCIFLHHQSEPAWPERFRELVMEEVQKRASHLQTKAPVALDTKGEPPASWFVHAFLPKFESDFLSTTELSQFLAGTGGLNGRVIWLYGAGKDQQYWVEQLTAFAQTPAAQNCTVILEMEKKPVRRKKIDTISAERYMTPFDMVQFATIAVSEGEETHQLKSYLVHLCVELAHGRPERLPGLLEQRDALLEDPERVAVALFPMDARDMIVQRIRRAQLKVILPMVEDLRIDFLRVYGDEVGRLLPFDDDFNNHCVSLYDVELRHLIFRRSELNIPESAWPSVEVPYQVRNKLMHELSPLDHRLLMKTIQIYAKTEL